MQIVLSGYYGNENTGDEALLEVLIQTFKKKYPDCSFTVLSNNPEQTRSKLSVNSVPRYGFGIIRKSLKKCDVFMSGAGGLLQDCTSFRSLIYYLGLILMAKFYGKPVVIFASGLGPLKSSRAKGLCQRILSKVDLILLRDHPSYKLAKELLPAHQNLFETGDLGVLFPLPEKEKGKELIEAEGINLSNHPLIGISIRSVAFHAQKREAFYQKIAESLDLLHSRLNAKLLFLLFQCPEDIEATSRVIDYLKSPYKIIFKELTPQEIVGVTSKLDLFIGMRLHSLVFSAICSVPALGISYDPKVASFMQALGLPFLSLNEIKPENILNLTGSLWNNADSLKEKLKTKIHKLKAQALFNFTLFDKFISKEQTHEILNVKVHNFTYEEMKDKLVDFMASNNPKIITTPNPEIIVQAQTDLELRAAINRSDLCLADGAGLVVLSRFIGKPIKERLSGIDVLYELVKMAEQNNRSVFLLGGEPGIAEQAAEKLKKYYPALKIAGTHHGYFNDLDDTWIIDLAKKARPAILFVGLGAPKQEKWIAKHYQELGIPVSMVVGGSFNIIAGKKKRAPEWIQRINLEWLYRLATEPKRWRRQLALLQFIFLIWGEMLSQRENRKKGENHGRNNQRTNGYPASRGKTV